jgi:hypothetical protein
LNDFDRTYPRYKTMIDAAAEARKFAEVNKIERMVAAAYPIATLFVSIADNVTKQFAEFEWLRIQAAPIRLARKRIQPAVINVRVRELALQLSF